LYIKQFFSENIKNPILVAEKVLTNSRHCLFAGEGALKFALKQGETN
jgi:isoaspartyl peptidase/L-asparaginase-like protein (Ntn-hydrolase superfamily)